MKPRVLVLGAGFAGIRLIQDLTKRLNAKEAEIILVDKNDFNLFRADLYEVATAFSQKKSEECLTTLKETIATPVQDLINKKRVKFIHDYVDGFDPKKNQVKLRKKGNVSYDYLAVCLGSVTNYYGIKGLKQYSYPMKKLADGIRINCNLDFAFHSFARGKLKTEDFNLVVCGGGATGIETAAEMVSAVDLLAEKYGFDRKKVRVHLIEGSSSLARFDKEGTNLVKKRLKSLGVEVHLKHFIKEAREDEIVLEKVVDGKKVEIIEPSNVTIWTGGVKINKVVRENLGDDSARGAILVDNYLRSLKHKNIFAAGDNAFIKGQCPVMLADFAVCGAKNIAKNIAGLLKQKDTLKPFIWKASDTAYYLPVGGKWAICKMGDSYKTGFFVWLKRRFTFLGYALSILPFWKALKKWHHGTKIFWRND